METILELIDSITPYAWVHAIIIVAIGLIVAKAVEKTLITLIAKIASRTDNALDDEIVAGLQRPLFSTIAITALKLASLRIEDALGDDMLEIVGGLLDTIIIIVWVLFFLRASGLFLSNMGRNQRRYLFAQPDTVPLLRNLVTVFLFLAAAYSILVAWNIDVTGLVASAGIVGLALSFAAQDTLGNIFAGVAILADRPYKIGDYVVLETGERGEITAIGLRSTRLMTRDDVEIVIPNGVMGSTKIVNESGGGNTRYRIRTSVGVAYGSDIDQVIQVLEDVASNSEGICSEPTPRVRMRGFGASSLDFELLAWIGEPAERGLRTHQLNCTIYRRFAEEKIVIPFPQQDVWVRELPSAEGSA